MGGNWGPSDDDKWAAALAIVSGLMFLVGSLLTLAVQLAWRLLT